jgi:hypothetical protein
MLPVALSRAKLPRHKPICADRPSDMNNLPMNLPLAWCKNRRFDSVGFTIGAYRRASVIAKYRHGQSVSEEDQIWGSKSIPHPRGGNSSERIWASTPMVFRRHVAFNGEVI